MNEEQAVGMGDQGAVIQDPTHRWNRMRQTPRMAMAVFILGIFSIGLLFWTNQISERGNIYFHLANALMDLQISAARSYLKLDEAIRGNRPRDAEEALRDLDRAIALCEAILSGGESEYGMILDPLGDPHLRAQVGDIKRMLVELKSHSQGRHQRSEGDGSLSSWDDRTDDLCLRLLKIAEDVETATEKNQVADYARARRLFLWILVAWSLGVVGATTGLWGRERQRRIVEQELLRANAHLERQRIELSRHRGHLMELVEERTAGLQSANNQLQREIAERRETEDVLRKREEQYRMLVETMNEGLTILDDRGALIYVNDRFCAMMGYAREELLGRRSVDFVLSGRDKQAVSEQLMRILEHDHGRSEIAFQTKNGQSVFTLVSSKVIYDTNGNVTGCFAVITDITEKVALQTERMRTAHLASLGEIAAGVAHEINNPTNGIINYARMLCDQSDERSQVPEISARILKEGRRVADIVRGLLLFARGGKSEKRPIPLEEILSNSLDLTGSQLRKDGIEILSDIPPDLPELMVEAQEMQQVFMNIMSNARHALNQKYAGRLEKKNLEIRARPLAVDERPYVRITFRDNGVGIPAGIIEKIKEPFFSTKPKGKGTGLGLSISDGIVSEHGGRLTIESEEGEYTRVVIDIPAGRRHDGQSSYH